MSEDVRTVLFEANTASPRRISAKRDLVALGIAIAAIFLLVATGGSVLPDVVKSMLGDSNEAPSHLLVNALLLNIALVLFGWRRYRELNEEIATREFAERQARELSSIDPLTGCLNRRAMTIAANALRTRATQRGQALAFVVIDLDNFKQVNDMHSHSVGDQVLVELANRVREQLPPGACFARLGGDEFAFALAYEPSFPERLDDLVIRLLEKMSQPIETDTGSFGITLSIGAASDHDEHGFDPLVQDAAVLMHRADIAMYQAKKQGKNRFFWFEPSMENELRFRNEIETGIRRGLIEGEFVPYYEQQIEIETGEIVGFEMLARWRSPQLGLVSPEIFIPIAEEIGLITELSDQLMDRAFADARECADTVTLSINISPIQLRDPWFAQKLLKRLVVANFPPHRLEIEITESCLHENVGLVRTMIASLRNQGVKVSLDDFGTGYSSLEQLRTLPFDRLKIDRAFISELGGPDGRSRIVDAIISLGRGLNLPITAEGIEDQGILDALMEIGDLKGQGYLYGKPEPAEKVRQRLRERGMLSAPARERADMQALPGHAPRGEAVPERAAQSSPGYSAGPFLDRASG
jgi:diguanylate cyclase (GGDEF)-like protein